MAHLPFRGSASQINELVSGQALLGFTQVSTSLAHVQSGALKAIAISGDARLPALPRVPTFTEAGLNGFDMRGWYGVLAPAGTPKPVIAKLTGEIAKILTLPDVREKLAGQGLPTRCGCDARSRGCDSRHRRTICHRSSDQVHVELAECSSKCDRNCPIRGAGACGCDTSRADGAQTHKRRDDGRRQRGVVLCSGKHNRSAGTLEPQSQGAGTKSGKGERLHLTGSVKIGRAHV